MTDQQPHAAAEKATVNLSTYLHQGDMRGVPAIITAEYETLASKAEVLTEYMKNVGPSDMYMAKLVLELDEELARVVGGQEKGGE